MRRLVAGSTLLVLGATAAAALAVAGNAHRSSAAPQLTERPAALPERIEVAAPAVREALAQGLIDRPIKTVLNVPAPMSYGEFRWDDRGIPAGPTWVRVDLNSQILSVFRAGHEIGTAVILYGGDSVPTPTGRFPILAKLKDHRSSTYDAAMPYTLRLTEDGVAIHASNVRRGYATHGCIGVPAAFAARLFDSVSKGDEVLITGARRGRSQS